MTQAELELNRSQKEEVTKLLQELVCDNYAMDHDYYIAFDGTDVRVKEYVEHVAFHPELHGIQEQLAVLRYFRLVRTYKFIPTWVKRFIFFAEHTPQEGITQRCCYKLTPVQVFISCNIFGFFVKNSDGEEVRMTRTAFLLVARKFSKTGFACLIMCFYFLIYGDDSSEIYIGANSTTQANVAFRELSSQILFYEPHAKEKCSSKQQIRITNDEIAFKDSPSMMAHRKVGKLSATSGTKDGLKPELGYIDEYAAAKDKPSQPGDALRNVIESGMGARKQPLMLITTTAGTVLDGPCIKEVDAYHDMLLKELGEPDTSQDKIFAFLAQPDLEDDPFDVKTWYKAQPHLNIVVGEDFYQAQVTKARLTHSYMVEFQTKNLNLFVRDEATAWFTLEQANALMFKDINFFAEANEMGDCVCAVDLMEVEDMCAVCYFGYSREHRQFRAHLEYYMPEESLVSHPNKELYKEWHSKGYLNITKGKALDGSFVADEILRHGEEMNGHLKRIRYDAAYSKDFSNRLKCKQGVPPESVIPIAQTILNYNQAMQYFDLICKDPSLGHIAIDYNPIFAWNLTNCVIITNHNGLRMPDKGRGRENKIDGADALLMCVFDAQENI